MGTENQLEITVDEEPVNISMVSLKCKNEKLKKNLKKPFKTILTDTTLNSLKLEMDCKDFLGLGDEMTLNISNRDINVCYKKLNDIASYLEKKLKLKFMPVFYPTENQLEITV